MKMFPVKFTTLHILCKPVHQQCNALVKFIGIDNSYPISLTSILSKILFSIIIRCLTRAREGRTQESQTGFRPRCECLHQILPPRQVLSRRHALQYWTAIVFPGLKVTFDLGDQEVL